MVADAVDVGAPVPPAVGVGAAFAGTSKTACAVITGRPPLALAIATKVGDAVPWSGAPMSPNANAKPSLADLVFKREVIEFGSLMVGAEEFCAP